MILVDTSAWVEFSRGTGSAVDEELSTLIQDRPDEIASTEPVLMELLAGGGRTSDRVTERLLRSFAWLAFDPVSDFAGAARVYQLCRAAGVTPRGLIDCMVVQVALRTGSPILAADRDFEAIARVMPLQLVTPSR
jgi:predicted nucleic acid-binding protein